MYISRETPEQTDKRLRRVIAAADLVRYEGVYAFHEYPVDELPSQEIQDCFALVRDDEVWSVLKRAEPAATETFNLFSFHFVDGLDNSGFVGWLATIMKRELGTGVLVVCGYNSKRGGAFDYWGVPVSLRDKAAAIVEELRRPV
ncbi:MAG TPA: DUF6196 family protein [Gammaproteobacteria bacterium]|nr:DUF6196 family protein [Gammaproteobacteria bacterium]